MVRITFLMMMLGVSTAAFAQDAPAAPAEPAEPTLPQNPTSPTDFSSVAPALNQGAAANANEDTGEPQLPSHGPSAPAEGYSGGDNIMVDDNPALYGGASSSIGGGGTDSTERQIPPFHIIKKGETLSTLCGIYYGDPSLWPKLWAYNKEVTNPHWIYPGYRVRLFGSNIKPGEQRRPSDINTGDGFERSGGRLGKTGQLELRLEAFADANELAQGGTIVGSAQEHMMLSVPEEIYLRGSDQLRLEAGQSYAVYRVLRDLKDRHGRKIGTLVEISGTARIKGVTSKKVATAEITDSYAPIERGFRVGPLRRLYHRPTHRAASKDVEAKLIDMLREGTYIGDYELVFLDVGKRQDVAVGNRLHVLRRGDGATNFLQDGEADDPSYPYEAIAELVIVDVRDSVAAAFVTQTKKEIRVGDMARTRAGK